MQQQFAIGSAFFQVYPSVDTLVDPSNMIAMLDVLGVSIIPKSMYLNETTLLLYHEHICRMLAFVFETEHDVDFIKLMATDAITIERMLVGWIPDRTELRNPYNYYHRMQSGSEIIQGHSQHVQNFWNAYFRKFGLQMSDPLMYDSPEYFENFFVAVVDELFGPNSDVLRRQIGNYLSWQLVHRVASWIPDEAVQEERFRFFGAYLRGQDEMEDRATRCVEAADGSLGFMLGKLYVDEFFPPEAKEEVIGILDSLKSSFDKTLENDLWMDEVTRDRATTKLSRIANMIGYPDSWDTYGDVSLTSQFFTNQMQLHVRNVRQYLQQIGEKTDTKEWEMTPPTVNAYYEPTFNEIVFPAGILQFPFYDVRFPDLALSYGGIGSVIGHELSHAFDDEGSQFDEIGRLENWWTNQTREAFEQRTDCIVDQYSGYAPLPGHFVNGRLTSGENIADNVGVQESFEAFQASIPSDVFATPSATVEDLTMAQLFFVQFAQVWCTKVSDQAVIDRILTDPHSPPEFRVKGTVSNSEFFARSFGCQGGKPMNPEHKCSIF